MIPLMGVGGAESHYEHIRTEAEEYQRHRMSCGDNPNMCSHLNRNDESIQLSRAIMEKNDPGCLKRIALQSIFLFFDVETTGLPKNYKASVDDVDNWPRIVQIAWILSGFQEKNIESGNFIIKPEGFEIPEESTKIHGITTQKAISEGEDLESVLMNFRHLQAKTDYIVAHNVTFDKKIVWAEMLRKNIKSIFHRDGDKSEICTMKSAKRYCKLPGKYGYKFPTLLELHQKLFGCDFDGAHDAATDIRIAEKCFWKMIELNLISQFYK